MRCALKVFLLCASSCTTSIDFGKGRAFACSIDGGDPAQCPGGFVCGLEGYCHDPAVASDYQCTNDSFCSAGWRCGFARRCVDPNNELLGPAGTPAAGAELLAPQLTRSAPTDGVVGFDEYGFTFRRGAELVVVSDLANPLLLVVDAGSARAVVRSLGSSFTIEGAQLSRLEDATGTRTALRHPSGGLINAQGATLRRFPSGEVGVFGRAGLPANTFTLVVPDGQASEEISGPPGTILDLTRAGPCVVAATSTGVAVGGQSSGWKPLTLPGFPGCNPAASYQRLRIRTGAGTIGFAGASGRDAGHEVISVFNPSRFIANIDSGVAQCSPIIAADCSDPRWEPQLAGCDACDEGESLVDFQLGPSGTVVECRTRIQTTQFSVLTAKSSGAGCNRAFLEGEDLLEDSVPSEPTNPGLFGRAGRHGQFWRGLTTLDVIPLVLDRAPTAVKHRLAADGGQPGLFVGARHLGGQLVPELGFLVGSIAPLRFASGVEGDPNLVLMENGLVVRLEDEAVAVAYIDAPPIDLRPPFRAALAKHPSGASALIASSFDTLYSATDPTAPLVLKLKPFPGSAITSFAPYLDTTGDAGSKLGAWALTANGLFNVRADTDTRWRGTDVPLPEGEPVKVWMEATRARIGFGDGTILSLPSRVPLAPATSGRAVDYLYACGQNYGLFADFLAPDGGEQDLGGVYRLAPQQGGLGRWVREDVGNDKTTFGSDALVGGKLFELAGRIYVFTRYGGALSFTTVDGCAAQ